MTGGNQGPLRVEQRYVAEASKRSRRASSGPSHSIRPGTRPFLYRRLDPAADPLGRGYTLYVPGADGVDNDGRWNPENPHAATDPVKGRGFDLVFNLPREAPR